MNRKLRRSAAKRAGPSHASASVSEMMAEARLQYKHGQFAQAKDICTQIIARDPAYVQSLNLLGVIAQASGDHKRAIKYFEKAVALDESDAACHYNIGLSCQELGRRADGIEHFKAAISLGMSGRAIGPFVAQNPVVADMLDRIAKGGTLSIRNDEFFTGDGVKKIANDLFLISALETTQIEGAALERVLTWLRAALQSRIAADIEGAGEIAEPIATLCRAIAHQCFINEYVFAESDEETRIAARLTDKLIDKLKNESAVPCTLLAIVGAYRPLRSLPVTEIIAGIDWPSEDDILVKRLLKEPLEELRDRRSIPSLTGIDNDTSLMVMQQYEENPYPRWTFSPLAAFSFGDAQNKESKDQRKRFDILIAGCGTGQHSVQIAQTVPHAHVLAIDISLTSLAYARRKTREYDLNNIEYARADILKLGEIGRTFDYIESVGVLHHLAEPEAGWRILLSLLRPGAEMRIGLYSELARRAVVEGRQLIAQRGYRATAEDIRNCRQEIIRDINDQRWRPLLAYGDFYSMSGCRDLLFNVMEHRFTIPRIAGFLKENGLSFLGFEFPEGTSTLDAFQRLHPDPPQLTDLDLWHAFESENPAAFASMYVFSAVKKAN